MEWWLDGVSMMQRAYVIDHLFNRECQIRNIPREHFKYDFVSEAVYHCSIVQL